MEAGKSNEAWGATTSSEAALKMSANDTADIDDSSALAAVADLPSSGSSSAIHVIAALAVLRRPGPLHLTPTTSRVQNSKKVVILQCNATLGDSTSQIML